MNFPKNSYNIKVIVKIYPGVKMIVNMCMKYLSYFKHYFW